MTDPYFRSVNPPKNRLWIDTNHWYERKLIKSTGVPNGGYWPFHVVIAPDPRTMTKDSRK